MARGALPLPPLRALDSVGGFVLGAAAGLALVWVVGASALLIPGQKELRRAAQQSLVLQQLYDVAAAVELDEDPRARRSVPEHRRAARAGRAAGSGAASLAAACGARRRASCACSGRRAGLRIAGSGWVAAPSLVVTAAHVVAGRGRHRRRHRGIRGARCARRSSRSTARTTSRVLRVPRRSACARCRLRKPDAGRAGRDPRLPGERSAHRRARPARRDDGRAERGRVRPRPGRANDHGRARRRAARQLRRADDRRVGSGRDDGVRGAARQQGRLRRSRATSSRKLLRGAHARAVSTGACAA